MAGKRTSGTLCWVSFVIDNPNWQDLELFAVTDRDIQIYGIYSTEPDIIPAGQSLGRPVCRGLCNLSFTEDNPRFPGGHYAITERGFVSIFDIQKPAVMKRTDYEKQAVKRLNASLKASESPKTVVSGPFVFDRITRVEIINGTPKADFVLIDEEDKPVGWISHKSGTTCKDFQQYSGLTERSGLHTHEEVIGFHEDISHTFNQECADPFDPFYRPIEDVNLVNMAVFGPSYGSSFGENHVHMIAQGDPNLTSIDSNTMELSWSSTCFFSGEAEELMKSSYRASLAATYRNDTTRKIYTERGVFRNVRTMTAPKSMIDTRTGVQII